MAKKVSPKINLEGLDGISFDKEPDIDSAQKIIEEEKVTKPVKPKAAPKAKKVTAPKEPKKKDKKIPIPKVEKIATPTKPKPAKTTARGTMPPPNKKRASFNIPADLHRALKDYSYFNEIEMVEYIFEQLVKPDLKKKGYYPPKKRK